MLYVMCIVYDVAQRLIELLPIWLIWTHELVETENESPRSETMYEGHIPISFLQRTILFAGSAAMALRDPTRHGQFLLLNSS